MSERTILRDGRIVDPRSGVDEVGDLLLEDGVVARRAPKIESAAGDEVVDAAGLVVTPGLIDIHVHLREPGFEYKETIASGLRAAAAGGFTAVTCMPNTSPSIDHRAVVDQVTRLAALHPTARLYPIGAISRGLKGEELTEFGELIEAGAVAFTDDGHPVANSALLRRAFEHAQHFNVPVLQHVEDLTLTSDGVMHEGAVSTRLGLPGIPGSAEDVMVARDLMVAEDVGGRYHLLHLSTARSLELVRAGKERGIEVTCEVTPHHLLLTDELVSESGFSTAAKMKPPLRSAADVEALLEGLADGTIDAIASDHAPHHPDEKDVQFSEAPFGIVGLETTLPLCLDRLVRTGKITLSRLVDLLSSGPALVLGIPGGTLEEGAPADVTLIDLEREVTVRAEAFRSLGRSTPFEGWTLTGAAVGTIVGGRRIEIGD